jgi:hypothetical protein
MRQVVKPGPGGKVAPPPPAHVVAVGLEVMLLVLNFWRLAHYERRVLSVCVYSVPRCEGGMHGELRMDKLNATGGAAECWALCRRGVFSCWGASSGCWQCAAPQMQLLWTVRGSPSLQTDGGERHDAAMSAHGGMGR